LTVIFFDLIWTVKCENLKNLRKVGGICAVGGCTYWHGFSAGRCFFFLFALFQLCLLASSVAWFISSPMICLRGIYRVHVFKLCKRFPFFFVVLFPLPSHTCFVHRIPSKDDFWACTASFVSVVHPRGMFLN
jgi:hypothetical protein